MTQSEARHPIQVVSRRTGLSPDVIRVWERRYGAVCPGRSSTNRRLYSDEDLERLSLLRRATLLGRAIGHVAQLGSVELRSIVEADEAAMRVVPGRRTSARVDGAASHVQGCLDAVRALDSDRLRASLHGAAMDLGATELIQEVLVPLMGIIGDEWRRGSVGVHHEHLATSMVRGLLDAIRETHSRRFGGPEIIVATPSGETHEIGALTAAAIAAAEGVRVVYLGADLPVDDMAAAVRARGAAALAISIVCREHDDVLARDLSRLRGILPDGVTIFVGGHAAASYRDVLRDLRAIVVTDVRAFRAEMARLVQSHR